MGIFTPTSDPAYDHSIDIDAIVPCSPLQAAFAMFAPLDPKFHEITAQSIDAVTVRERNRLGRAMIWVTASLTPADGGTRVRTTVSRARTTRRPKGFFLPIGRRRIRTLDNYHALMVRWAEWLAEVDASGRPAC